MTRLGFSLAIVVLLSAAIPTGAMASVSSCGAGGDIPAMKSQGWPARQRLYFFDSNNRLFQAAFDGSSRKLVSDRGFDPGDSPMVYISPDGRFVAYGSNLTSGGMELWLLDLADGSDRMLLHGEAYAIGIPVFSADSRRMAVDIAVREDSSRKDIGLYAFDLGAGTTEFAGWPSQSVFRIEFDSHMFPAWTADNQLVLGMVGDGPNGEFAREFWRYDLGSRHFDRIEGRYDDKAYENMFAIAGKWLAMAPEPPIPGRRGTNELPATGGRYIARVDAQHRLEIQDGGSRRIAALGSYSSCEGESLRLNGWVDGDRYLVFTNGRGVYIHDPRTGNTASLALEPSETMTLFWGPPGEGLAPN